MKSENTITSYKGFDANLQCRGFQYEIGKTYEHAGRVEACGSGFHACEHPLNVFSYYSPASSRFALVEQSDDLSREPGGDTNLASRKITIKAELSLAGLIKAAIEYTFSRALPIDPASPASATGYQGAASATGYQGAASGLGFNGKAMGSEGSALFLVHRKYSFPADDHGKILHASAVIVGQDGIKPNTWYALNDNGEVVEAA